MFYICTVMPGPVPGIPTMMAEPYIMNEMAGTSPAMTNQKRAS
jgi:hypothetical protein